MTTPAARWAQIKQLFDACLDLPGSQRDALIAAAGLSADALADLRSLLVHHEAASAGRVFLVDNAAQTLAEPSVQAAHVGQRLGAWEVVRAIGAGGMGEVFEARRADGTFEGRAAVKVLKRGMDSSAVLQRFALERQALARLSHPHIARLLDAGASGDGLPYFVLEYVDGQPIDEAAKPLPLPQRLALFLQLADAVAHAHRNLLVHRDLKPSNVLVDAQGQVKLLDFGIAKALDPLEGLQQKDSGNTTVAGQRPYTPNYASPEQVRGEPVSTATDIYSLGVLLYQMLTGTRPTGRDASTPTEAARSVLEEAPTRPSRLSAREAVDPQWLQTRKTLAGDLDNILLKALEKTQERRYASVDALAADVRAYLGGHPVSARAGSSAYVARRFLARHRVAAAASALGLLGLVAGLAVALVEMRASEQARQQAERRFQQVRQMAGNLVFSHHDRIAALPGAIAARDALLADGARYLDSLVAEGAPEPGLAREAAETYWRLAVLQGEYLSPSQDRVGDAEVNLDKALALLPLYIDSPGLDPAAWHKAADMWLARASMRERFARLADVQQALEQARALAERALAVRPGDPQAISRLASVEGRLGRVLGGGVLEANLGRMAEALPHLRRAVELLEPLRERDPGNPQWPHELAWAYGGLAQSLMMGSDPEQAAALSSKTVALRDEAARAAPDNAQYRVQTAVARMALASVLSRQGRHGQALALQDEAAAVFQRMAAADAEDRSLRRYMSVLGLSRGVTLWQAGRGAEARPLLLAAVQALAATPPPDFEGQRRRTEALLWAARGWLSADPALALGWAQQAQALMQGGRVADPNADANATRRWLLALALGEQAAALQQLGRRAEASAAARQALVQWQQEPPARFATYVARDRVAAAAAP